MQIPRPTGKDIRQNINDSNKLLIAADKTTNYYKMSAPEYQQLLQKIIIKDYKKVDPATFKDITAEAKQIAENLNLGDES